MCLGHAWSGGEPDSALQRQILPVLVGFCCMEGILKAPSVHRPASAGVSPLHALSKSAHAGWPRARTCVTTVSHPTHLWLKGLWGGG